MIKHIDLSHLTPDEQKQIRSVMRRQQDEEEKEKQMLQVLNEQFEDYKSQINNSQEASTDAKNTQIVDSVCPVCKKTKFVEGSGHFCSTCQERFCSRCGGKITLRSNKTVWICNVCRKQKEIVAKSGSWFHGGRINGWDSKSLSGSEKENLYNNNNINTDNHADKDTKSNNSSREASEKSQNTVLQFQRIGEGSALPSTDNIQISAGSPSSSLKKVMSPSTSKDSISKSEHSMPSETVDKRNFISSNSLGFSIDHTHKRNVESAERPSQDRRISEVHTETIEQRSREDNVIPAFDSQRNQMETSAAISSNKTPFQPTSAFISHSANPILQDLNRTGSMASFDDEIQSITDYSSFGGYVSDYDFPPARRSALHEQSNLQRDGHKQSARRSSDSYMPSSIDYEDRHDRQPTFWQPSSDGKFLIGHLTLSKNLSMMQSTKSLFGFKVVGGKTTSAGRLGAFITRVKKGSLADTVGHLKIGDEVVSWNDSCLQDAAYEKVKYIIQSSMYSSTLKLVVSRPIRDVPLVPEVGLPQTADSSTCSLDSDRRAWDASTKPLGKIQIKICYDPTSRQLSVTAMQAINLPMRERGLHRNPYVKMYLLPNRNSATRRKTKTAKKTLNPEWMQTFVYTDMRTEDLGAMALELTVWDLDRSLERCNEFIGEVIIDLGLVCLDDEPHWFWLMPLGQGIDQEYPSHSNETTSCTHAPNCDTYDISPTNTKNNPTDRSAKPATKRRILPPLPKNFNLNKDEDTTDLSSLVETEPDIGESASHNLSHSQYGNTCDDSDSLSMHQTMQAFVGGTGPGQVVGRQALAMSPVGEIELGLKNERGKIVIQVIRAFNLSFRQTSKSSPAFYVKVYMMDGMRCVAKKKTKPSSKAPSPVFKEAVTFESQSRGNLIQVIVWAIASRIDSKVVIGVAEISLEELDLLNKVTGRYKLFPSSTLDLMPWSRHDSNSSFGSSSVLQS